MSSPTEDQSPPEDSGPTPDDEEQKAEQDATELERAAERAGITLDAPLRAYLREISRVPPLSIAQELELAQATERRDYLAYAALQLSEPSPEAASERVRQAVRGTAGSIAATAYAAFSTGWPAIERLFAGAYSAVPAASKPRVLNALLPLTRIPADVLRAEADRGGLPAAMLGEHVRLRCVEWDLLPLALQRQSEPQDAALEPATAAASIQAAESELSRVYTHMLERGDLARERLTEANLRLVANVATEYAGQELALLDLIQAGNQGLIRAVETYQAHKGYTFSSYAAWWIRQALTRAVANRPGTAGIPSHLVKMVNRLIGTTQRLQQELGRAPTIDEIALALALSPDTVRELQRNSMEPASMDAPSGTADAWSSDLSETHAAGAGATLYCARCAALRFDPAAEFVTLKNGMHPARGRCRDCGTRMFGFGTRDVGTTDPPVNRPPAR